MTVLNPYDEYNERIIRRERMLDSLEFPNRDAINERIKKGKCSGLYPHSINSDTCTVCHPTEVLKPSTMPDFNRRLKDQCYITEDGWQWFKKHFRLLDKIKRAWFGLKRIK